MLQYILQQSQQLSGVLSIVALLISFWSVRTNRRLWYLANRPVISATIIANTNNVNLVLFDLVVFNSGNKPAIDIVFYADKDDIDKIVIVEADEKIKKEIYQMFSETSMIQLLVNGDKTITAFWGCIMAKDQYSMCKPCILKYDKKLPIKITYGDLEGNRYISTFNLRTRDSKGFGGSTWESLNIL